MASSSRAPLTKPLADPAQLPTPIQQEIGLGDLVRRLVERRGLLILLSLLGAVFGWALVLVLVPAVYTSSATLVALPEAEEVDVDIDDNDLRIDTYRASGPGGQSVNTMDSAVRITHLPTGLVVSMQDEKSQLKNKNKALRVLRSRLLQIEQEKADAAASDLRRGQVSTGDRSEKIRTYNYKENRVTDHRLGLTIHRLDRIVAGDLDEISDALVTDERARQLQEAEAG